MKHKSKLRSSLRSLILRHLPEIAKPALYRNMIKLDSDGIEGLELRLARSQEDLASAFRLLHDNYVREGYMNPHPSGMRLTKFHVLPSTTTLIASVAGQVVGTVSLVRNGAFGTPLESIYDVSEYHRRGTRIAEVSSLAVSSVYSGRRGKVLFPMLNYLYHYCEHYFGVDYLAIAVSPRWWDFYRHILLFEKLKSESVANYAFVNGAAAVGGVLNLRTVRRRYEATYGKRRPEQNLFEFLGQRQLPGAEYPTRSFAAVSDPVMTPQMLHYFFRQQSDVLKELNEDECDALWNQYQTPAFRMILPRPPITRILQKVRNSGARHDVDAPVVLQLNSGQRLNAFLKNVNARGAMIRAERGFRKDEQIILEIEIEAQSVHRLNFEVVWSNLFGTTGLQMKTDSDAWLAFVGGLDADLLKVG